MFARQGTQPQQQPTEDHQDAWQEQVAIAPDSEDAATDAAAQQPETADDKEASQDEVAMAPDDEDALSDDDAAQQPATDDDAEASQAEVALASDDDDTRGDDDALQQPATDDDEDASLEEVAVASDAEAAPADDAAVMETANAQVATDPDDGFSFAAFPKPVTPADVVKEAMPAEQLSHEDSSGSGAAESETAHPDVDSEDVGNAAPSKEPVVHHSDLAP
jgi:phosphatidylglycerol---prolipoprotein diacylglyceryl transferase